MYREMYQKCITYRFYVSVIHYFLKNPISVSTFFKIYGNASGNVSVDTLSGFLERRHRVVTTHADLHLWNIMVDYGMRTTR